ncbi:MAG: BPL-N domain-containing protein [Prosthecobacter sp.]
MHLPTLSKLLLLAATLGSLSPALAQEEEAPKKKFVTPPDVNGMKSIIARPVNIRALKVGVYAGPGSPQSSTDAVLNVLKPFPEVHAVVVTAQEMGTLNLGAFDVIVFPGGSGSGQSKGIGEAGVKNVREFVKNGGGYVGICAGAYLACSNFSWGLGILNAGTVSSKWRRGQGIVDVEMTGSSPEILGDVKGVFKVRYNNGPILKPGDRTDIPAYTPLVLFRTEMALNDTPVGVMVNSPAQAVSTFGKGRVFVSSPHPEGTPGLENLIPRGVFWAAGDKEKATAAAQP